jgi:hypothetical protein
MKVTSYSKKTGLGYGNLNIKLEITKHIIEEAIADLIDKGFKVTKKLVQEHITYMVIKFGIEGGFGTEVTDEAIEISIKLFPDFYLDHRI